MTTSSRIFRQTCALCARPALTVDEAGSPRCAEHADAFIGDTHTEPSTAERWAEALLPPDAASSDATPADTSA